MSDPMTPPVIPKRVKNCSACEKPMTCDLQLGKSVCWCFSEEPLGTPNEDVEDCVCRSCLRSETNKETS